MGNLIKNIEMLKASINELSVYDLNCYTAIELYYRIANKLNEVVKEIERFEDVTSKEIIKQNKEIQDLIDGDIKDKVVEKIQSMVNDGSFDTIINYTLFDGLKEKMKVDVKDFGAKGDGITDDTEAIQNAINFVGGYHWAGSLEDTFKTIKGGTVVIPAGKYKITSTIFLPPYITIEGQGNGYGLAQTSKDFDLTNVGSVIIADINDTTSFAFDTAPFDREGNRLSGTANNLVGTETVMEQRQEGITIKNLTIYNDFKNNKILFGGISLKSAPYSKVIDVGVVGADIGIYINASWCVRIIRCGLFAYNYGIYAFKDVNNVTVDSCDITQVLGHTVAGTPVRRYNNSKIAGIYMEEGDIMPANYVTLSTGIYLQAVLQLEVRSSTIECWERGLFSSFSACTVEDCWFEAIQIVDIQRIQGNVITRHNRKETYISKHIRSGGDDGLLLIDGLSGNNKSGASISDFNNQLIDNISNQSKVVMNNCNNCDIELENLTPFKSAGLSTYSSNAQIREIRFIAGRMAMTENAEMTIELPTGFDRWNTYILGFHVQSPNGNMIVVKNMWLSDNNLIFTAPCSQENTFYQVTFIRCY